MRNLVSLALVTSLVTSAVSAAPDARLPPPPPTPALRHAASIAGFGAKLHGELATRPGNLVYSPSSIAIALAMTREGAAALTATEMDRVLGTTATIEARSFVKALAAIPKGGPELTIANRLFGDQRSPFRQPFLDLVRDHYGAPLEKLDFRTRHEDARARINAWVEQQTKAKIKNLLAKGTLDELTRLVLVNAIYLKAAWATPFAADATKPAAFTIAGAAAPTQVPTMHNRSHASWGAHAGARILDLPYAAAPSGTGPRLSMMLVVPDTAKLDAIEATYAKEGLAPFTKGVTTPGKVDVALPKFRAGTDFDLGKALAKLGMPRAFTDNAEFPAMTMPVEPLKISKVIHKAWIDVDEKGTEAAAATAVIMAEITSVAVPQPVHKFAVDRSFLFFIHDQDGNVLFGGRVLDPTAP